MHILDVEDHATRQHRIQCALEKLNSSSTTKPDRPIRFDFGERKTYAVEPPSELLSRVQAFLPQLEASNAILARRVQADSRSVDIEAIEESDTHVIEMNLGLGVFEDRSGRTDHDVGEDEDESMSSDSESSSDDSDSSTSSESSDTLETGGVVCHIEEAVAYSPATVHHVH